MTIPTGMDFPAFTEHRLPRDRGSLVATLPGDESQFSRELDARFRERFPVGTAQDKVIGYLVGANFAPDWPQGGANA